MKRRVRIEITENVLILSPFVSSIFITMSYLANVALVCDDVDFDEPMEVGHEEEKAALTEDAKPEPKAVVKVEPNAALQNHVLL